MKRDTLFPIKIRSSVKEIIEKVNAQKVEAAGERRGRSIKQKEAFPKL